MLKKVLEDIGTASVDGVTNIVSKKEPEQPGDRREQPFEVGSTVVEVNKIFKVKSVKGDDLEVLGKDGTVSTVKVGDVVNIVVKA